jgi:hypothetical protein
MMTREQRLADDAATLQRAAEVADNYMQHGLSTEIEVLARELRYRSEA